MPMSPSNTTEVYPLVFREYGNLVPMYAALTIASIVCCLVLVMLFGWSQLSSSSGPSSRWASTKLSSTMAVATTVGCICRLFEVFGFVRSFSDAVFKVWWFFTIMSSILFTLIVACIAVQVNIVILSRRAHFASHIRPVYEGVCVLLAALCAQTVFYSYSRTSLDDLSAESRSAVLLERETAKIPCSGYLWAIDFAWESLAVTYCLAIILFGCIKLASLGFRARASGAARPLILPDEPPTHRLLVDKKVSPAAVTRSMPSDETLAEKFSSGSKSSPSSKSVNALGSGAEVGDLQSAFKAELRHYRTTCLRLFLYLLLPALTRAPHMVDLTLKTHRRDPLAAPRWLSVTANALTSAQGILLLLVYLANPAGAERIAPLCASIHSFFIRSKRVSKRFTLQIAEMIPFTQASTRSRGLRDANRPRDTFTPGRYAVADVFGGRPVSNAAPLTSHSNGSHSTMVSSAGAVLDSYMALNGQSNHAAVPIPPRFTQDEIWRLQQAAKLNPMYSAAYSAAQHYPQQ
ncbi:hypothetical protein EV182_002769 [Spiromyces aspiralis]|uniref:Uncharacterized protein n=1 Tax=Spiromyces aspiralis TaxID=68401 RepID=A0ACC1HG29_9FUNG|nr:hypothetical protein EV182_002769 [Spiromyces aspiralis]